MKTKIISFILICLILNVLYINAQQFYYSAGKKNYITIDSTTIIAKINKDLDIKNLKMTNISKVNYQRVHIYKSKELIELKFENNVKSNEIKNSEFEKFMYGYKIGNNQFHLTGEILLQPKKSIDISQIVQFSNNEIFIITSTKYNTFKMGVKNWGNLIDISNKIYESGLVEYCHPNFIAEIVKNQTDPLYQEQFYLNNTGQLGGTIGIDINAPEAWGFTMGLYRTRVAVIDDGVENHEDIDGRVLPGFTPTDPNGIGAPANPAPPANLLIVGHGQACAGIVAATHNNIGIAGISQCSDIVPINIFDDWIIGTDLGGNQLVQFREDAFDLADAFDFAWDPTRGDADVISNSWSYLTTNPNDVPNSDQIIFAINRARTQGRLRNGVRLGCIVVFASGNYNQTFSGVTFPANVDGVITVGAINNQGNIWNYSSRGIEMDLVTPSGNINLLGNIRTTDRMGANGYEIGNYTNRFGGTSAACPQVSGVAALMLSINPNLTEAQIVSFLRNSATDMGSVGFDNIYGYGRLNAQGAIQAVVNTLLINGNTEICSTNSYYSISNLPANINILWQCSNNITVVSGQNTNNFVVKANTNGNGWVRATLTGNGCGNLIITKNVWVGLKASFSGPTSILYLKSGTWIASASCGSAPYNYDWFLRKEGTGMGAVLVASENPLTLQSVPAGTSLLSAEKIGDPIINQPITYTIFYLYLRASDSNGKIYNTPEQQIYAYGNVNLEPRVRYLDENTESNELINSDYIEVFPNPASDNLTIKIISSNTGVIKDNIEITIFDKYMNKRKAYKTKKSEFMLNMSDLKSDIYFVQVRYNDKQWVEKLIIK